MCTDAFIRARARESFGQVFLALPPCCRYTTHPISESALRRSPCIYSRVSEPTCVLTFFFFFLSTSNVYFNGDACNVPSRQRRHQRDITRAVHTVIIGTLTDFLIAIRYAALRNKRRSRASIMHVAAAARAIIK